MIEQIKQALENATPDWHDNGNEIVSKQNQRVGIGGFLKDEDNHLAANAPEWLRYLIGEVERLKGKETVRMIHGVDLIQDLEAAYSQVEELQKALEQIYHLRPVACEWTDEKYYEKFAECEEIARQALERSESK